MSTGASTRAGTAADGSGNGGGRQTVLVLGASVGITAGGMLPPLLLGAMAVQVKSGLRLTNLGIGVAVGVYFAFAALLSVSAGMLTDRFGPRAMLIASAASSIASLTAVAALARSPLALVLTLLIGAPGAALSTPATNALVGQGLPLSAQGFGHGVKQAAIPLASLLGGLAVPALGLTIGWRWAFLLLATVPIAGAAAAHRVAPRHPPSARARAMTSVTLPSDRQALVLLAVGAAFSGAAVTSLNSFGVVSTTDAGLREGVAGLLLGAASVAVIIVRVGSGLLADRSARNDHLGVVVAMLLVSTIGFASLASKSPLVLGAAMVIALTAGWGWTGLFMLSLVSHFRARPSAATGIVMTGIYAGAVLGPVAFGLLSRHWTFRLAWALTAAWELAAAAAIALARARLRAEAKLGLYVDASVPTVSGR